MTIAQPRMVGCPHLKLVCLLKRHPHSKNAQRLRGCGILAYMRKLKPRAFDENVNAGFDMNLVSFRRLFRMGPTGFPVLAFWHKTHDCLPIKALVLAKGGLRCQSEIGVTPCNWNLSKSIRSGIEYFTCAGCEPYPSLVLRIGWDSDLWLLLTTQESSTKTIQAAAGDRKNYSGIGDPENGYACPVPLSRLAGLTNVGFGIPLNTSPKRFTRPPPFLSNSLVTPRCPFAQSLGGTGNQHCCGCVPFCLEGGQKGIRLFWASPS